MKGGGSQTTTSKTVLPKWVEDAAKGYLASAQEASKNLAAPYQGPAVAEMNPQQAEALARVRELSNFTLNPENISGMMNPFIGNVEQAALAQGQRALTQNLSQASDAAIRARSGFGSRQGVIEGAAIAENAQNQANLSAQLRAQGYQGAIANLLAGQDAAMRAAQAGYGAGTELQKQQQALLAADEARYNAMRNFPLDQLNIIGTALGQTPYGKTTVESTPLTSNPLMGLMGGAMGFANAFPGSSTAPFLGGGLGFLSAFPGISDPGMKTDIEKVGKDKETGLNMYAYRYKGDPKTYPKMVGPMADEIAKKYPDKVKKVGGKLAVDMNFLMGKVKV